MTVVTGSIRDELWTRPQALDAARQQIVRSLDLIHEGGLATAPGGAAYTPQYSETVFKASVESYLIACGNTNIKSKWGGL